MASALKIGRTSEGYRLRVEGRGTMRESRAAQAFALKCKDEPNARVAMDLSACEYLDSTFQGCLLELQREYGQGAGSRFSVANPSEKVKKLLNAAHVDRHLNFTGEAPAVVGEEMVIPPEAMESREMMQHVMECHRHLAQIGGPQTAAFAKIAESMEKELASKQASK
jgi:anti-anti-sigma regulatory factor